MNGEDHEDKSKTSLWDKVKVDANGLVPCIAQDADTGTILMMAWVNEEALAVTLTTNWATYWSRSRKSLWTKGKTSGNKQKVLSIRLDCDGDTLIYSVQPEGPACHLGTNTCFSWIAQDSKWIWTPENG